MINYQDLFKNAAIIERHENLEEARQLAKQVLDNLRLVERTGGLHLENLTEAIRLSHPHHVAALLQLLVMENCVLKSMVTSMSEGYID